MTNKRYWLPPVMGIVGGILIALLCIFKNGWPFETATLLPGPMIGFTGGCMESTIRWLNPSRLG